MGLPELQRPRVRRPQDTGWTIALGVVGALALTVATGALLVRQVNWSWQPLVVLAAVAHVLMYGAPVAVVCFAVVRRWYSTAVAAGVLAVVVLVQAPLYIGDAMSPGGTRLTMLQANLRRGSADARALVDQVVRNRVDILATEELSLDERDRLVAAGLSAALPYRVDAARGHGEGGAGIALWSRFPLTDEHVLPGFALGAVSGVIRAGGVPVTVVAVHLVAPFPNPAGQWAAECRRLSALLGTETSGPLVVGGDFNATPDNAQFRQLLTGPLRDAAEEDGAGYVSTYPADRWFPPLIAIDHVLVAHAQAGQVATVALPGSDHRGLRVRIRIGD